MGLSQIEVRFLETMISCARSIAKSLETLAENDTKRLKIEMGQMKKEKYENE